MTRTLWAPVLLTCLVAGCNRGALPLGDAASTPMDLSALDRPLIDLAGVDLADPCALSTTNATVVLDGRALGYAWLGNVDLGGEANCGGAPEGVQVYLAADHILGEEPYKQTYFVLTLPIKLGPQTATVYTKINGDRSAPATVTVTGSTPGPISPALDGVEGDISAPALGLSGHFAPRHCRALDIVCI